MLNVSKTLLLLLLFISCGSSKSDIKTANSNLESDLVIAFGSCNKQSSENVLWKEVVKHKPSVWIWGGDNIYSDTDDMQKMKQDYEDQLQQKGYKTVTQSTKVLGTWDDHDYGLNDGGEEFRMRNESQQLFLDFMGVDASDRRRDRLGVYHSEIISSTKGTVKVIALDTRFFRSPLTKSSIKGRRYDANPYGEGTILGKTQWQWLKDELNNSTADFNLIVSSIQVVSEDHGFERWATMPHQRDHLLNIISNSKARNVIILTGDRHISEFSKLSLKNLSYPLIDFTSSGLTHSYNSFTSETNMHREGKVVSDVSFGVLKFDFKNNKVLMEMRGKDNVLQQALTQRY